MVSPKSSDNINSESKLKSCNRGHWRPAEDERLRQLVKQYGPQNWNFISEHIEGRSGKSCRLRWYNQLDPNIIKKAFSEEEEERLLALHKMKGNKWAAIARFFPGRTDNAVKNHFHVLTARRKRERLTLFGDHGHNNSISSRFNFGLQQNYKNKGIFGMCSRSILRTSTFSSSTITSSFNHSSGGGKSYDLDHSCSSNILGSYHSFTAPGLPSIGKVVPIQRKYTNSNSIIYGHDHHSSNKGKHPARDNYYSMELCKLSLNNNNSSTSGEQHEEAVDDLILKQKGTVSSFIDFLGVGTSSSSSAQQH